MTWMSVNAFKRRYGIGKNSEEREGVAYEEFHVLKDGTQELRFEHKKRYVRLLTTPMGSVVSFQADQANDIIESFRSRGFEGPKKASKKPKKDLQGYLVYGELEDAFKVPISIRETGKMKVGIFCADGEIPHLRDKEVDELLKALKCFIDSQMR